MLKGINTYSIKRSVAGLGTPYFLLNFLASTLHVLCRYTPGLCTYLSGQANCELDFVSTTQAPHKYYTSTIIIKSYIVNCKMQFTLLNINFKLIYNPLVRVWDLLLRAMCGGHQEQKVTMNPCCNSTYLSSSTGK